jgi:hypothetical protein
MNLYTIDSGDGGGFRGSGPYRFEVSYLRKINRTLPIGGVISSPSPKTLKLLLATD